MRRISVSHPSLLHQNALPTHKVHLYSKTRTQVVSHLDSLQNVSILFPKAIHASLNPQLLNKSLAMSITPLTFAHAHLAASMSHSNHRHYGIFNNIARSLMIRSKLGLYARYPFKSLAECYLRLSKQNPFLTAMVTGGSVLTLSDFIAQHSVSLLNGNHNNMSYDYQRTLALFAFGFFYYGMIGKAIYMSYDILLGKGRPLVKAAFDSMFHTPFLLIPSFYMITGTVKGQNLADSWDQLKREYQDACGFSILYWIPLMFISFKFCSQETRVLFITGFSLIHKSVLSWFSNRDRVISNEHNNSNYNNNNKTDIDNQCESEKVAIVETIYNSDNNDNLNKTHRLHEKPKEWIKSTNDLSNKSTQLLNTINTISIINKNTDNSNNQNDNNNNDNNKREITFNFNSNIMKSCINTNSNIKSMNTITNKKGARIDDIELIPC